MNLLYLVFGVLNFYLEPVVYRAATEGLYYLEFNGQIPYQELFYEELDKRIIGRATIAFKLTNALRTDSLLDTLYRQFTIPSFSQAAKEKFSFIVQFGMFIPTGTFEYEVEISSDDKKGRIKKDLSIAKENYQLSDLLLASNITQDTTGGYLNKGELKVIPRASRVFTEDDENLYVYYEVYDFIPDSNQFTVTYKITDKNDKTIRKVSRGYQKKFKSQDLNAGLNIQRIEPGEYSFSVEVFDSSTGQTTGKAVPFEIIRETQKEVSYEGLPFYEELEYFVSPAEYRYFNSLKKEGKASYLKKFWAARNYNEISEKFAYAKDHYAEGNKLGYKTDRGRIYIKFGAPDEVEKNTIEIGEFRPYECWHYYNGLEFIFVDIRATSEYTLIWTNARGERCQPSLYNYLPPAKQREIE